MADLWTLYLDFDGVLNNTPFLRHQRNTLSAGQRRLFDVRNVIALETLCHELPVGSIVVTSTWRDGRTVDELRALMAQEGFQSSELVVDVTGTKSSRVDEILEHVSANKTERYLVIDDMNLRPLVQPVFFQTSGAIGLDEALVRKILNDVRFL